MIAPKNNAYRRKLLQDMIDALPDKPEEYTFVGTRDFFKRAGINTEQLDEHKAPLSREAYRRLWTGEA